MLTAFLLIRLFNAGFAHPLPFRVAVAVEDTSSASMTYVLLKLDADMPSKQCVRGLTTAPGGRWFVLQRCWRTGYSE